MKPEYLVGAIAAAAAVVLALSLYWRSEPAGPEPISQPTPTAPVEPVQPQPALPELDETPPSPEPEAPVVVLPVLDESDEYVRERLSGNTLPEPWLGQEDLLRRLAVVVENVARGQIPRRQLAFLAPQGKFQVAEVGERVFLDPRSYARFDRYVDMLESVPAEQLADFLVDSYPLLDEAVAELGTTTSLVPQLLSAIDQVLAVPVLEGDVELLQPKVFYEYADPALEALSPLQKQLLRMGPDNVLRVQAYARAVREGLVRR